MSGDEVVACVVCAAISLLFWARWYFFALRCPNPPGLLLAVVPPLCAVGLFYVLHLWASHDVRDDPIYLAMYLVMGAAWAGVSLFVSRVLGLNIREDVINRRNAATACLAAGAMLGTAACFAGANVGEGPGWWVVVFAAGLSTGALLIAWGLVQAITGAVDNITIDRDLAGGLRLGAVLVAMGLIMGRAVAGDWVSASATVDDFFRIFWPVFPLMAFEIVIGRMLRPSPQNPVPDVLVAGIVPAIAYLGWSAIGLILLGHPA